MTKTTKRYSPIADYSNPHSLVFGDTPTETELQLEALLERWCDMAERLADAAHDQRSGYDSDEDAVWGQFVNLRSMFEDAGLDGRSGWHAELVICEAERIYRETCEDLFGADHFTVGQ